MNSIIIIFTILTITFPIVTYIATNSFISSIIVLVLTGGYLFIYAYQKTKKMNERNKRFHSCYSFINTFIISLSIKGSLLAAFDSTKLMMDKEYQNIIDGVSNLNEIERLDYLKKHYDFDIYYLFLSTIKIWIEEGGNILKLSHYLIDESKLNEDYLIKSENINTRKIIEFSMLWSFVLFIIIILRYSLNSFYLLITKNLLFQVAIVSLFVLLLLSVHILLVKVTRVNIKEYKSNEKV